uniref:Uncharacterized protein n=1 Tax=Neogobius melanostomus TaxID=47308 RepID=A0A8C6SYU0_9GOBI
MSNTLITMAIVPDLAGVPPSIAVSVSLSRDSLFSRSKPFCNTNSGDKLSPLLLVVRVK